MRVYVCVRDRMHGGVCAIRYNADAKYVFFTGVLKEFLRICSFHFKFFNFAATFIISPRLNKL